MTITAGRAPLVVLCSVDDWRFDTVNHQPDRRYWKSFPIIDKVLTPHIDSFADESVCFTTALSSAGFTPPSHASLFTGTYACQHGVVDFWRTCCRDNVDTISELFARAGYRTVLHTTPGRRQLFCEVNQSLRNIDHFTTDLPELKAVLERSPWEPTLLIAHWVDVHEPLIRLSEDPDSGYWEYRLLARLLFGGRVIGDSSDIEMPDGRRVSYWNVMSEVRQNPEAIRHQIRGMFNGYHHGVEKFDAMKFGPFLQMLRKLPIWNRTIMAVTSDHGEIQSHTSPWKLWHGPGVEEQLTRVPLMIRAPGFASRLVKDLVGSIDLLPTLLELAGIDSLAVHLKQEFDGHSLTRAMSGKGHSTSCYWIESWFMCPHDATVDVQIASRALRYSDGRKYVHNGDWRVWERIEHLGEDEFAEFLSRTAFLSAATPWFKGKVKADMAAHKSRWQMVMDCHGCGRPALAIFDNVNDDICEARPVLVGPKHPRWCEFQPQLQHMLELAAEPNPVANLTPEQESLLNERLAALGYVEL